MKRIDTGRSRVERGKQLARPFPFLQLRDETTANMDKEKLKEAASTASDNAVFDSDHWNNYNEGFVKGADWLMTQSLADRLTDEEKEKVRGFYNGETFCELDFMELVSTRRVFESLFGKDLFNEK